MSHTPPSEPPALKSTTQKRIDRTAEIYLGMLAHVDRIHAARVSTSADASEMHEATRGIIAAQLTIACESADVAAELNQLTTTIEQIPTR